MSEIVFEIVIEGRVQGVGYRWFAYEQARKLGLKGYVQNRADGSVFLRVSGNREDLLLLSQLLRQGPAFAQVINLNICELETDEVLDDFKILH